MVVSWDGFVLDADARRLSGPDGDIHVEPQVFDVLVLLIAERARVVSKAELLEVVWGDQFVSESALTTRIKQARRSLGDDGRTQRYVRNVHGRGYQFVGDLDDDRSPADGRSEPGATTEAVDRSSAAVVVPRAVDVAREIAVDDDFPFVGRLDEMAAARTVITAPGGYGTVVIAGSPGVGKSRLAVELLTEARSAGARIAAGRCEQGVTSALQAVRDAFGQVAATDPGAVAEWAAGIEGPLLALLPSLTAHLDHQPVPVDAYAGMDVFLTALDRLTADRPLALLIDDLQWSDEPTRTFLERVERRLHHRPITVILTHRIGRADLPGEVARWLARVTRRDETVAIGLDNLAAEPARDLIRSVLEDATEADVDELLAVTEANCLFLTETLRELPHGGETAQSVAELITARVDRQSDDVRAVITAGAALGPEFPLAVAAEAAGLEPATALAAIDRALEAELLHETASPARFRFSHQLVPQSIVEALARAERADLHLRCAEALGSEGADEAEIVLHLLRAVPLTPLTDAVDRARARAALARAAKQYDLAARLLGRANDAGPPARIRAEIQLELARVINDIGTPAEAVDLVEGVAQSARTNGWPDLLVGAALAHWSQSPYRRPLDTTTLALLAEADEALGPEDSVDKALVLAKTATFSVFTRRLPERGALADRAVAMAREQGADDAHLLTVLEGAAIAATCPAGVDRLAVLDPEIARLREATGLTWFRDASAPETLALLRGDGPAFRDAVGFDPDRLASQPIAEWRDLTLGGTLLGFAGDIDGSRDRFDRAAEMGERFWGESSFSLHAMGHLFLDLVSGRWTRSRELLELAHAFADGESIFSVFLAPTALAIHHQGGREAEVAELSSRLGGRQMRSYPEHILGGNALIACGELALARDDDELATLTEAALEPLADLCLGLPWAPSLAAADVLARFAARRGDTAAADRHRAQAMEIYAALDAPVLADRLDRL
ncbi:MAG: AAA family ATPase [Actinomycetota bacterium]